MSFFSPLHSLVSLEWVLSAPDSKHAETRHKSEDNKIMTKATITTKNKLIKGLV